MTLFAFIRQCLRREAARTEPDCTKTLQKVLNAPEQKPAGMDCPSWADGRPRQNGTLPKKGKEREL